MKPERIEFNPNMRSTWPRAKRQTRYKVWVKTSHGGSNGYMKPEVYTFSYKTGGFHKLTSPIPLTGVIAYLPETQYVPSKRTRRMNDKLIFITDPYTGEIKEL